MADEIYINQGTQIQQPYQGQIAYQAFETTQRVTQVSVNRQGQQPYPFIYQSPSFYVHQAQNQQPTIKNAQNPFTYARQGQQPTTYDYQSPFTYQNTTQGQNPFIRNIQQPYPYIADAANPVIRNKQTNVPNINKQSPFTYDYQSPSPYIAQLQQPVIRDQQSNTQVAYQARRPIAQVGVSQPHTARSPYIYQHQQPRVGTYQTGSPFPFTPGRFFDDDSPAFAQYQYQIPFNNVQGQNPYNFQAISTQNPYPYIANGSQPVPYITQAQVLTFYYNPFSGEDHSYRTPGQAQAQTQSPFTYSRQGRTPTYETQQPYIARQPNRSPGTYEYLSPYAAARQAQNPFIRDARQPVIYQYQQPSTYDYQSPSEYARQGQTPFTYDYQSPAIYNNPASIQQPNIRDKQVPYPYIADARQPSTYDYQSPSQYSVQRTQQVTSSATGRNPFPYIHQQPQPYIYNSPYIARQPYSTTRPIDAVAKVKGVFVNNQGVVAKAQEVYVHAPQGLEKIHQAVPNAQFQKGSEGDGGQTPYISGPG